MNNKFCISRKIFFIILLGISIFFILFSFNFNKNTKTVQSKAALYKIIGGTDVSPGEYPSVALIKDTSECTGTLINPRWVITAFHCVKPPFGTGGPINSSHANIAVNITNISDFDKKQVNALMQVIPPEAINDNSNDIALILLDRDIVGVPLPKLPDPKNDANMYTKDNVVTEVGWGCIGLSPTPGATIAFNPDNFYSKGAVSLQKLSIPINSAESSPNRFTVGYNDERAFLHSVCFGDSGGPVFYKKGNDNFLIGIIVAGYVSAYKAPDVAMKVINYVDWINKTISTVKPPVTSGGTTNCDCSLNNWNKCHMTNGKYIQIKYCREILSGSQKCTVYISGNTRSIYQIQSCTP